MQTGSGLTVSATSQYDAFGNLAASTGTWKGPFAYGGPFGYQSDASGLKLLGHRYYDSGTGRFLTRDPVKDGRNWYGYCYGSPVSLADNNGELPFLVVLFLWGVAAGGVMELCPILPSPGGIAKGVEKGVAKGIAKEVLVEVGETAAKQAVRKHHWIPREIIRLLEEIGIKDARIRGVKGAPNVYLVPKDWHDFIHMGKGGGAYNDWWKQQLEDLGPKPKVEQELQLKDQLLKLFHGE
ncbi:MAG: RHS repeat-associated core domain-containing protein [Armatimonadetes bacterium]|nr:RHS repeat-associated core domain-containing protein [Armatimonadota bacterium]